MSDTKTYQWGIEEVLDDNPIRHRIVTVQSLDVLVELVRYLMDSRSNRKSEIIIVREPNAYVP